MYFTTMYFRKGDERGTINYVITSEKASSVKGIKQEIEDLKAENGYDDLVITFMCKV